MAQPVPGEPVAVAHCGSERVLVVADYHAGLEIGLRRDGVEIRSHADERRERLCRLLADTAADRVVFLGDLGDALGKPAREERAELRALIDVVTERADVTIIKGNHDGAIESVLGDTDGVELIGAEGVRLGDVGFCHGHTWPAPEVVAAPTLCTAHEHPQVRLEDEVGGSRTERVWLRGRLDAGGFDGQGYEETGERLVVYPAYNDLSGGTYVNEADGFLSPFLPEGLADGEAYLLDGTRLGPYEQL